MNYEEDIKIDETSLDVEWLEQASLMMRYARNAAKMEKEFDEAKERLEVVKAELDQAIRTDPETFGLVKITEQAIFGTILLHPDYKDVSSVLIQAKFELNMAKIAVRAFEQRKEALENLVKLHGQQYFAGPKVPRDLTWEREQHQIRSNRGVASALQRKRLQ